MKVVFKIYRQLLSPVLHFFSHLLSGNPMSGCRFVPTCSEYSEVAIQKFGLVRGGAKSLLRICRCHPFSGSGGFDPV